MALFSDKLPPELRANIFQYYFTHKGTLCYAPSDPPPFRDLSAFNTEPYWLPVAFDRERYRSDCNLWQRRRHIAAREDFRTACVESVMMEHPPPTPVFKSRWIEVALLLVNKATYHEACDALFVQNRFLGLVDPDLPSGGLKLALAPQYVPCTSLMTKYRQLHLVPTREGWTKDDDERTPICLNPYPFIKIATEIKVQYPQLKVLTVHVQSDWDIFLETTTGVREDFMENTAVYGPWSATFIGVGRLIILGADKMRTIFQNDAIVNTWIWICQCAPELLEELRNCPNLEQEQLDAKERVEEELDGIPALEAYFSPSTSHNVPTSMIADYWARVAHYHPEYAGCGLDSFELWTFILQLWPDEDD